MHALVATLRKLLHAIYGKFKHHQPFDGRKFHAALDVTVPALALSGAGPEASQFIRGILLQIEMDCDGAARATRSLGKEVEEPQD